MKVNISDNALNFKQIKLSKTNLKKARKAIELYRQNPSDKEFNELYDIFKPHIEEEASKYKGTNISVKDYKQNLYIKIAEFLNNSKCKNQPEQSLINKLNSCKPTSEDTILTADKSIEEFTEAEQIYLSKDINTKEKTTFDIVTRLIDNTESLFDRERYILKGYLDKISIDELALRYGLTKDCIRAKKDKGIIKMRIEHVKGYKEEHPLYYNAFLRQQSNRSLGRLRTNNKLICKTD